MIIVWTEYMDSDKYQKYFDDQVQKNYYPVAIRGRCISGINKYKAIFVPYQPGQFSFFSHHGLSKDVFDQKHKDYADKDFARIDKDIFISCNNTNLFCGTWIKRG